MDIYNEIVDIFVRNDVAITDDLKLNALESIQFMTIVVEIEQQYGITLPNEMLERDNLTNLDIFINRVLCLLSGEKR